MSVDVFAAGPSGDQLRRYSGSIATALSSGLLICGSGAVLLPAITTGERSAFTNRTQEFRVKLRNALPIALFGNPLASARAEFASLLRARNQKIQILKQQVFF